MNLGGEVNNHSSQPPNLHTIHKEVNLNQKVNQRGDPSALLILLLYLWKNIININNCNNYNYYLIRKKKEYHYYSRIQSQRPSYHRKIQRPFIAEEVKGKQNRKKLKTIII